MTKSLSLSHAKAGLAEVVRAARTLGQVTIITADGEPAARVVPIVEQPHPMTDTEAASVRALLASLRRIERPTAELDAKALVGAGRR